MHYHAERGNDKGAAAVEDRSSRSAWERRQGRSAFRLEGDAERHGMHYHAERGNDKGAAAVEDRSSRSAWERRQGRSAFRFWKVTQSVTGMHYHAERGNDHKPSDRGGTFD